MLKILLAAEDPASFMALTNTLEIHGITVDQVSSGESAFNLISDIPYDLLISDEILPDMTGRTLIEKTVTAFPLINCVAVSSLSSDDFHDLYEGMGVMMQFPLRPDTADVEKLLYRLNRIYTLAGRRHS